jgi:hypothetical protein
MRYYIVNNSEGKEAIFDLTGHKRQSGGIVSMQAVSAEFGKKDVFIRQLAGKNYISFDSTTWEKLATVTGENSLTNVTENLKCLSRI